MLIDPYRFGAAGPTDPDFANVILLMDFDGTNGSTSFIDKSSHAWTLTPADNAQLTTTAPRFGTAAGLFDGAGDYVECPTTGFFQITTADFTVEASIKPNTVNATRIILSTRPPADRGFSFYISSAGKLSFNCWDSSGNAFAIMSSTTTMSTASYTDVAVTRAGSVYKLWVNGVVEATVTVATAIGPSNNCRVAGDRQFPGTREFDGRIDNLRFTSGVARAITVPTAAFPTS